MSDSGSDNLRDELARAMYEAGYRNATVLDVIIPVVERRVAEAKAAHDDACFELVYLHRAELAERRVAEAKDELERWKAAATVLLEQIKVNGRPALETVDITLAVGREDI